MTTPLTTGTRGTRAASGFTLVEVMMALAILGFGLTVLIKSAAGNISSAQQAHMIGVVTDLARAKMYDIEEKLLKDGFSDTEQTEEDKTFTDEGWPLITYSYKVEEVELPGFDQLQELAKGHASKTGSGSAGSGSGEAADEGGFGNSALGGMMSMLGGGLGGGGSGKGSGDIDSAVGASFIQGQYTMFQQILKVSIRKVSLTVKWQVLGSDRDMKVVQFLTDAAAMDKVISGLGSQDLDDQAGGKGSGGKGSGGGSGGTLGGGSGGTLGGGGTPGGGKPGGGPGGGPGNPLDRGK